MTDFTELKPQDDFFVLGGSLRRTAPSYIHRQADDNLFHFTKLGEYCHVLAARQMGKSSLMVQTRHKLLAEGINVATLDLSTLATNSTNPDEWFSGVCHKIAEQLNPNLDLIEWWQKYRQFSPAQRFEMFLQNLVENVSSKMVIFVDEIDSTKTLDFTDDFFAIIRSIYNKRATDEHFSKLCFVLLGVVRPNDLIKNRTRTPYNIGTKIDLTNFRYDELGVFRKKFEEYFPGYGGRILRWILSWTGGQPYLTQRLSAAVVDLSDSSLTEGIVDNLVIDFFLKNKDRGDRNLRFIRERILESPHRGETLKVYQAILNAEKLPDEKGVIDEEISRGKNELKTIGLIQADKGYLRVSNKIYRTIFDEKWVTDNMPRTPAKRYGIISIFVIILSISISTFLQSALFQESQAHDYITQFNETTSNDLRMAALLDLNGLGDNYPIQACEMFSELDPIDQLDMIENFPDVATQQEALFQFITACYQRTPNTVAGNRILTAMKGQLNQSNAFEPIQLVKEIQFWLDGREQANISNYMTAIESYKDGYYQSETRVQPNPGILCDRAEAYLRADEGYYHEALQDYEHAVQFGGICKEGIKETILSQVGLAIFFDQDRIPYPALSTIVPTFTSSPTPSATLTPSITPSRTSTPTTTGTPSPTKTAIPTATFTNTSTSTVTKTPIILIATNTFTPSSTNTKSPPATPSPTIPIPPSPTPTIPIVPTPTP